MLKLKKNAITKRDPTLTVGIRKAWRTESNKRFNDLKRVVNQTVIKNDAFGLQNSFPFSVLQAEPAGPRAFAAGDDATKVAAFVGWFDIQIDQEILQESRRPVPGFGRPQNVHWTEKFIEQAYLTGVRNADKQVRKLQRREDQLPGRIAAVSLFSILAVPAHRQALASLKERTFNEIQGITQAVTQQASRKVSDGLLAGATAREITADINNRIEKIGQSRLEKLLQTEVIRAHAEAQLNTFSTAGITEVTALVEFRTQGDERVCPQCESLEGNTFNVNDSHGIIPCLSSMRCCLAKAARINRLCRGRSFPTPKYARINAILCVHLTRSRGAE